MFVSVSDLKKHVRIESDDLEFDYELNRFLNSAHNKVLSFVNRNVYETLPDEPLSTDILINDSIRAAILDLAGYYFDYKGSYDANIIHSILESTVGHLRLTEI